MRRFGSLPRETQREMFDMWLDGCAFEISRDGEMWDDCLMTFDPTAFYRYKSKELVIPWDMILPEYIFAAMSKDRTVGLYKSEPSRIPGRNFWYSNENGVICPLIIDTAGVNWLISVTKRPA